MNKQVQLFMTTPSWMTIVNLTQEWISMPSTCSTRHFGSAVSDHTLG